MDNITETVKSVPSESLGFLKYVFNFDDENKCEMLNMGQYAVIAIIPVLLLLKAVKHIIPEEDDSKGSLEIMAESIGQLLLIICAIWFTNKMIRFVPTYSGCDYGKFNATNFLLPFLIILATMQTKLGAKLNILLDRVVDKWEGRTADTQQQSNDKSVVRVSQPLAGQHQPSQADYQDRSQILPSNPQLTTMPQMNQAPQQPQQISPQQSPDFNQMYQNQATPLQDASTPSMSQAQEPMAANEAMGGMFGGSAW
jgi:hypothetical protein